LSDLPHRRCRNLQQLPQVQRQAQPCGSPRFLWKGQARPCGFRRFLCTGQTQAFGQRISCGRRRRPRRQRQRGFRRLICSRSTAFATVVTSSSSHRSSVRLNLAVLLDSCGKVRLNPAVSADSCVQGRLKPSGSAFPVGDAGGHDGSDSVGSGDSSVADPPHRHCRNLQQLPQVQCQAQPCDSPRFLCTGQVQTFGAAHSLWETPEVTTAAISVTQP
jgi:hypothetical protein